MEISEPRAIIFYADITGFTTWGRRVRQHQVRDLLRDTYAIYDHWSAQTGFWMKKESDGFIAVRDLKDTNDRGTIIRSLRDAYNIGIEVNQYLCKLPFPRPPLFRVRGVLGDVWKLIEDSGRIDYGGYQMNFGKRMIDLLKETVMIMVSEGTFDSLGRRGCHHLIIERVDTGPVNLVGVESIDQQNFYTYRFNRRICKGDKYERCHICPIRRRNKGR